jgi:uncharacterized protein (DUF1810 family)
MSQEDPYNLERFVEAQKSCYERVLKELKAGRKQSHWMWFVFPQLQGLGRSTTARRYAISGPEEAKAYLTHPLLGERLKECVRLLLEVDSRSAIEIFGSPDDLKLRSCMTLFDYVAPEEGVFHKVLDKFYHGEPDSKTLALLD